MKMCFVSLFVFAFLSGAVSADLAEDILGSTGVDGGLVVHLGCGTGELTARLRAGDSYVVQGLDAKSANVVKARSHFDALGLSGKVTARKFDGKTLPYKDNMVNLVVSENPGKVSAAEIMRVLAPKGVAYIKKGGKWSKRVKPWPEEIDEWTHFLHGPDNNPVANDTVVDIPRGLQWTGGPKWTRHHEHMAGMSACVSAGGKLFYIIDEGPIASIQLPPDWTLAARDAFNGTVLWKKRLPDWYPHLWPLKAGPAEAPRRLVAVGDYVYVTLGYHARVSKLEAGSGEVAQSYARTEHTREMVLSNGVLFMLIDHDPEKFEEFELEEAVCWDNTRRAKSTWQWTQENHLKNSWVVAMDSETGKVLWKKETPVVPRSMAVDGRNVCFHNGVNIVCLARDNGDQKWLSAPYKPIELQTVDAPTLILYKDVVVHADKVFVEGLSLKTGKSLWKEKKGRFGTIGSVDAMVIDGLVWVGDNSGKGNGELKGRDPATGELKRDFMPDIENKWFHHRCYPAKGTSRFVISARTGTEFANLETEKWEAKRWLRGTCIHGIVPCNGMLYATPHSCACFMGSQLKGFNALTGAKSAVTDGRSAEKRLLKGPGYSTSPVSPVGGYENDWPTYRHDAIRSGASSAPVSAQIERHWRTELGAKLSSITVAEGKLFVSAIDLHKVYAIDAATGKVAWTFRVGARVDSPPTVYKGLAFFGSNDGHVYCVRASDGVLVWRFRAAPGTEQLMSYNQLESVWPVHGSVLIQDDVLYCVAGRTMFLDGGLRLIRLKPLTGEVISETVLDGTDPNTHEKIEDYFSGLSMPASLTDILSSDGKNLYMRSNVFALDGTWPQVKTVFDFDDHKEDELHLFSPAGFLDDNWLHRVYWLYGSTFTSGCNQWHEAGRYVPAGRIMVFDDDSIYGFGRKRGYFAWSSVLEYHFFATNRNYDPEDARAGYATVKEKDADYVKRLRFDRLFARDNLPKHSKLEYSWSKEDPPFQARALVLANRTLFAAGPPDVADEEEVFGNYNDADVRATLERQKRAFAGKEGALLWAVSATDGKKLSELEIGSPPVFDGMAAANGKLYLAAMDGSVSCFGE